MATQGTLSIIKDNKVFIKVITGSNGYNMPKLKEAIAQLPSDEVTPERTHEIAKQIIGDNDSLITQYAPDKCFQPSDELELVAGNRYHDFFFNAEFNPRWEYGIADYTELLALTTQQ